MDEATGEATGWIVAFVIAVVFGAFTQWMLRKSMRQSDELIVMCKQLVIERDEARRHATGWRDLAVDEGLGEGDGEDILSWEEGYLQPRSVEGANP